jgi:hypothetical protein
MHKSSKELRLHSDLGTLIVDAITIQRNIFDPTVFTLKGG